MGLIMNSGPAFGWARKRGVEVMSKIFEGNVSIFKTPTSNKIVVKPDPEGMYNNGNVADLASKMKELAVQHKAELSFFLPETVANGKEVGEPIILAGRGKMPYIAMLPPRKGGSTSTKLA